MGFEPTTFCMASRRSSQLSYSRRGREYSRAQAVRLGSRGRPRRRSGLRSEVVGFAQFELEPGEAAAGVGGAAAPAVREPVDE
jgi:hypothetical protein